MEFHEDTIFKVNGQEYGQDLIEIINIKGKIIQVHPTEYCIIDPKMYKPDLVFELEDKIVILEFQSTNVDVKDKKRFRFYTSIIDYLKNKSNKPIEVHVLSTVEKEKTKYYKINKDAQFPIYIHSLKRIDGDKFLNKMNAKIGTNKEFTRKELLMISLSCFMKTQKPVGHCILNSAITITNIPNLNDELTQFVKGVLLILCDKFVEDKSLNTTITNIVGGNMKIIEEYAQRKVDEKTEEFIINLDKKGFSIDEIVETVDVNIDFVKKILSKKESL